MANILLIDDIATHVKELDTALRDEFKSVGTTTSVWIPDGTTRADEAFEALLSSDTFMVVTDYDLTGNGKTGLFGSAIVDWCKSRFIPVGDYSRGQNINQLPRETDQYEIRVPSNPVEAARYIRQVYDGFATLRTAVHDRWDELSVKRSPSAILAEILGKPLEESRFALYGTKIGISNPALIERLSPFESRARAVEDMKCFLPYVLGHLLLNVILRFPGPIMHAQALGAFLGVHSDELGNVEGTFDDARYQGPFSDVEKFFWTTDVEQILNNLRDDAPDADEGETIGELNRRTLQHLYGRELKPHDCQRCHEAQGGLYCPFTKRAVCQRPTCSVPSNAWIPQGARLCRIEREFYDEWAPLLGF